MSFQFSIIKKNTHQLVTLEGSLMSRYDGEEFILQMEETIPTQPNIVFDLNSLRFISSEGLGICIQILTKCRKQGGDVWIINLSTELQQLFIITKLNSIFTILNNEEALTNLWAASK
jgi:anti-sigma B factor antagonist